jgi:hypothetical protein
MTHQKIVGCRYLINKKGIKENDSKLNDHFAKIGKII